MGAVKERNQNPVAGDTITLRLVAYNSNNYTNVKSVNKVDIYYLDPTAKTEQNEDGRTLVTTITQITQESTGIYSISLVTSSPTYVVGCYRDVWTITPATGEADVVIENNFDIFENLWYFATIPAVYNFDFRFTPNRIRQGSVKWLIAQIIPNVPRATELEKYYTNLAISSDVAISIVQTCGPCVPPEQDLKIIVDQAPMSIRDKVFSFYLLDTREMDCSVYDIFFTLSYAGTIDVSPKFQLQIY